MKSKNLKSFLVLFLVCWGCSASSDSSLDTANYIAFLNGTKKSSEVFIPENLFYQKFNRLPDNEDELNNFLVDIDAINYSYEYFKETKLLNVNPDSVGCFVSLKPYNIHSYEDTVLKKFNIDSIDIHTFDGKFFLVDKRGFLVMTYDSVKIETTTYSADNKKYFSSTVR